MGRRSGLGEKFLNVESKHVASCGLARPLSTLTSVFLRLLEESSVASLMVEPGKSVVMTELGLQMPIKFD
jgi:hypothetical protein